MKPFSSTRPLSDTERALLGGERKTRAATPLERLSELPADANRTEIARAAIRMRARIVDGPVPSVCPRCDAPMEEPTLLNNGISVAGCLWCHVVVVGRQT